MTALIASLIIAINPKIEENMHRETVLLFLLQNIFS
jgi:hypothetical protein